MNGTKYVGLDVHKATTVIVVLDSKGDLLQETIVATKTDALREFFSGIKGSVRIAFEEGCQAAWLYDLLTPIVAGVLVANPRELPRRAGRNKNDKNDALLLARSLRSGDLTSVYHGEHGTRTLKQLARHYSALVDDCTSVKNRIKAAYRSVGIDTPGRKVYSASGREVWLGKLEEEGMRFRVSALLEQLDLLRELRTKAQRAMVKEARRHQGFALLTTVPGLGPLRTAQLIAILDTPHRFRSKRSLWAYAGFAVVQHESSEYAIDGGAVRRRRDRVRTRGLNRNGNRRVKELFKSAAATACWRGPMAAWYRQRVERGLAEEVAQVSLARKIAAVALAVWKRGEAFDEQKLTGQRT